MAQNGPGWKAHHLPVYSFVLECCVPSGDASVCIDPRCTPVSLTLGFRLFASRWFVHVTSSFSARSHLYQGDFEEIYAAEEGDESGQEPQSGQWDAILTCFFIDTVSPAALRTQSARLTGVIGEEYRQLPPHHASITGARWRLDQSR